ncbi:hypothetical protein ACFVX4_41555, partial [Streptomyces sp. NPDC058240]
LRAKSTPSTRSCESPREIDSQTPVRKTRGPSGLLHHVNPRIGLREDDFRTLIDFAQSLDIPRATG